MSDYWKIGTPLKANIIFTRDVDGTIDWHVPSPGKVNGEFMYFSDLCNLIREFEKQAKLIAELEATQDVTLINRLDEQRHYNTEAVKRIDELEAENRRLMECLAKFPKLDKDFHVGYNNMSGLIEFNAIIAEAEELLKGDMKHES